MNIPRVTLEEFDVVGQQVQLDLGKMLKGTDVSQNSPSTAPGCMGESSDPDCQDIFKRLGLGEAGEHEAWSVGAASVGEL